MSVFSILKEKKEIKQQLLSLANSNTQTNVQDVLKVLFIYMF